jgi:hypothetical protein
MQNCEICYGKRWYAKLDKNGVQMKNPDGLRQWRCFRCGTVQTERAKPIPPIHVRTGANILYIDLEVSFTEVYNYGLKVPSKYISPENLIHPYYIIGWSASYMHETKIYHDVISPQDAIKWSDAVILPRLFELMQSADIIAGHNVDSYDIKRANTRFFVNGMGAVTDKKTLDTLKIARRKFAFESNRLSYICEVLGLRGKDDITRADWLAVLTGDAKVIKKIERYNINDVRIGKNVLKKMQAYSGKKTYYGSTDIE